jgi:hypothetical protein
MSEPAKTGEIAGKSFKRKDGKTVKPITLHAAGKRPKFLRFEVIDEGTAPPAAKPAAAGQESPTRVRRAPLTTGAQVALGLGISAFLLGAAGVAWRLTK